MSEQTLFIINSEQVLLDIKSSEVLSIDKPDYLEIAQYLMTEWEVKNNTTDVISYESTPVEIIDPLGTTHNCTSVYESRRERDSQQLTFVQSLLGVDNLLDDYEHHGFDIGKMGIIELVTYALGEECKKDTFEEYNFSFKVLNH